MSKLVVPSGDAELRRQGLVLIKKLSADSRRGPLVNIKEQNAIIGPELLEIERLRAALVRLIDSSEQALTGILPGKPKREGEQYGTRTQAVVQILTGITEPAFRIYAIGALSRASNSREIIDNAQAISAELAALPDEAARVRCLAGKIEVREPEIGEQRGRFAEKHPRTYVSARTGRGDGAVR